MPKLVQVRAVPDAVHRTLKVRATQQGKSLSSYLREELRRLAERPTLEEVLAEIARDPPVIPDIPVADMIREDRESH